MASSVRRQPQRGNSMDSQTGSVAEGKPPKRRVLRRATNLLTTKGLPVPAIAETILRVESPSAPSAHPRSKTSMSNGTHGRAHSNSASTAQSLHVAHSSGGLSRRRSDGSASLGLGRSIRRTLKGVVRSTSRSRDREAAAGVDPNNTPMLSRRSVSQSPTPNVSDDTAAQSPTRRRTSIKGHIRSASDVISAWTRPPRVAHSLSEPLPDSTALPQSTFESGMVTSMTLVGSPDEMSSVLQNVANENVANEQSTDAPKRPLTPIHEPPTQSSAQPPPVHTNTLPQPAPEPTPLSPQSPTSATDDVPIPPLLLNGVPMLKVSPKKQKRYFFRLDPDEGQIIWQSKKLRISEYAFTLFSTEF